MKQTLTIAPSTMEFLKAAGVLSDPRQISLLLRAMATGTDAINSRADTILIAAAEMIEAFARRPS